MGGAPVFFAAKQERGTPFKKLVNPKVEFFTFVDQRLFNNTVHGIVCEF